MIPVIPAIDLRGGQCVRLYQGRYDRETVYEQDAAAVARMWQQQGAPCLHVVDLDAARGGSRNRAHNRAEIADICAALDIPVQVGGGIRSMADIRAILSLGAQRVILGTAAAREPDLVARAVKCFTAERVAVGIDAKDGEVCIQGWTQGSGRNAVDLALEMERRGVRRIVYTDIARDGTMQGPNLDAYRSLGRRLSTAGITASGGVGSYQDLVALRALQAYSVDSIIIGRALYEGRITHERLWQQASRQ